MPEEASKKKITLGGYTPAGYSFTVTIELDEIPTDWTKFEQRLQACNISPQSPVGTRNGASSETTADVKTEAFSHICGRNHSNKDGSETIHIGFYSSNKSHEYRSIALYLNTPSDEINLENAIGLKIADLPIIDADAHPKRDSSPRSQKYVLELPTPLLIEYRERPYTDEEGTARIAKDFVRYVLPKAPKPPTEHLSRPAQASNATIPPSPLVGEGAGGEGKNTPPLVQFDASGKVTRFGAPANIGRQNRFQPLPFVQPDSPVGTSNGASSEAADTTKGSMPQTDGHRGKPPTRLRVKGDYLEAGDIIEAMGETHASTDKWLIQAIGAIDLKNNCKRKATVLCNGQSKEVEIFAGGSHASMYVAVGGTKLAACMDDSSLYEIVNRVGATWKGGLTPIHLAEAQA